MSYIQVGAPIYVPGASIDLPYIAGITKFEGTPKSMRFSIHDRLSGQPITAGYSNGLGEFKKYLATDYVVDKQCFVVTFDDTGVYNAQISDLINAVT